MLRKIAGLILILVMFSSALVFCDSNSKDAEYLIAVNNLLEISVYQEPDLSKTVRVESDGTIAFPLLGNIYVLGMTSKMLEHKLTELLAKDYLVNPQVSVFIKEFSKISILGQVKNPGSYELKAGLNVVDAIALAGGLTDMANPAGIQLTRTKDGKKENMTIDLTNLIENENQTMNILLEPDDVISVMELGKVTVVGQVKNPGRFTLKQGMTAIEAIALAGGLAEMAAPNGTQVIRVEKGKKKIIRVPVGSILQGGDKSRDVNLKSDDTVVVPESFF